MRAIPFGRSNQSSTDPGQSGLVGAFRREKGKAMTVNYENGVKVMKLHDCQGMGGQGDDAMVLMRIWQLLSGGHTMRDASAYCHRLL
jgi:hypothetical protein